MKFSLLFLLVVVIFGLAFWMRPSQTSPDITTFDACARAGYPIMESFPRQCTTPDGRMFTEEAVSGVCRYQQECGNGFFCRFGLCTEFIPETSCQVDDDCQLIRNDRGYLCCWIGACDEIDYSLDVWIAVNGRWFAQGQQQYCPSQEECGPAPMCPVLIKNEDYRAKCITPIYCIRAPCPPGICEKIPL